MIVIPAVDIRKGQCAQLVQGKLGTERYYGDPVDVARGWEKKGAQLLHVVDLDAALGKGGNFQTVKRIKEAVQIPVQFGGGIRDLERAREVLDAGIDRVMLGTAAIAGHDMVKELGQEYGINRIMVAVDSRGGEVVVRGWTEQTGLETLTLIKHLKDYVFGFLVTDVDREGLMKGVDVEEFKRLSRSTDARLCASGGISSQEDIEALDRLGIWGCVLGRALYEGKVGLKPHKGELRS